MVSYEAGASEQGAEIKTPLETPQNASSDGSGIQWKEIFYNAVNSCLTGLLAGLVLLQADATLKVAILGGLAGAITRFKIYWDKEQPEYCGEKGPFCFI